MLDCQRLVGIWWLGSTRKKGLRMEALFRGFLSHGLRTAKRPLCVIFTQKRGRFFIYSGMPCCIISLGGMRLRSSKREACSLRWRSLSVAFSSRNIPFSFKSFRFSSASSSRWPSTFSSLASSFSQRAHGVVLAVLLGCVCSGCGMRIACSSPRRIGPRPKKIQSKEAPKVLATSTPHKGGIFPFFFAL